MGLDFRKRGLFAKLSTWHVNKLKRGGIEIAPLEWGWLIVLTQLHPSGQRRESGRSEEVGMNDGHVLMVGVSFTDSFLVLEGKSLFLFLDSSILFICFCILTGLS